MDKTFLEAVRNIFFCAYDPQIQNRCYPYFGFLIREICRIFPCKTCRISFRNLLNSIQITGFYQTEPVFFRLNHYHPIQISNHSYENLGPPPKNLIAFQSIKSIKKEEFKRVKLVSIIKNMLINNCPLSDFNTLFLTL